MSKTPPKLFISYSWSSPDHESWVLNLASELRENGVDVTLDKWDLKEGNDAHAFMEQMVTDPEVTKVILVCDRAYAEKADERAGGVGTEAQIISSKIYEQVDQDKFVAVLSETDEAGRPFLPAYYSSRIYIDMSDTDLYAANFEQLLRWAHDKPLHVKPRLGEEPAFLSDPDAVSLGTAAKARRALDALRNGKPYVAGAVDEYLNAFAENFENFRIEVDEEREFDDQLLENIDQFIPYRTEFIEVVAALAAYEDNAAYRERLHRFFERLIPYMSRPSDVSRWNPSFADNFKFIIQELFIHTVAVLLKQEAFSFVEALTQQEYFVEEDAERGYGKARDFGVFRNFLDSLDARNRRLDNRRLSLQSDLLHDRSGGSALPFRYLMQADLVLFLVDASQAAHEGRRQSWWPDTLLYSEYSGATEIFTRARSTRYFERLHPLFGIASKEEFDALMQKFAEGELHIPKWQFHRAHISELTNSENLCLRP